MRRSKLIGNWEVSGIYYYNTITGEWTFVDFYRPDKTLWTFLCDGRMSETIGDVIDHFAGYRLYEEACIVTIDTSYLNEFEDDNLLEYIENYKIIEIEHSEIFLIDLDDYISGRDINPVGLRLVKTTNNTN